jgi:hypothetical protein
MNTATLAAIISALTALAVTAATLIVTNLNEKKKESKILRNKYLNPLRLYLEENYFRISEILQRVKDGDGKCKILLYIESPEEVSNKDASWCNGKGCYLISSCYFTACLFVFIKKVREDIPYLRLKGGDDTKLLNLIFKVSHSFLQDLGIYYAIQHSIGEQAYIRSEERCMTYQEFCEALLDNEKRIWFDRLLKFYLDTAEGKSIERANSVVESIYNLSAFLDNKVRGGPSIRERLRAENVDFENTL